MDDQGILRITKFPKETCKLLDKSLRLVKGNHKQKH